MFWLGNPFVRLRPAASFCRLSAADLKQAGAGWAGVDYDVNPDTYSESRVTATARIQPNVCLIQWTVATSGGRVTTVTVKTHNMFQTESVTVHMSQDSL